MIYLRIIRSIFDLSTINQEVIQARVWSVSAEVAGLAAAAWAVVV